MAAIRGRRATRDPAVSTAARARLSTSMAAMDRRTFPQFFAPKDWAVTMPKPLFIPEAKSTSREYRDEVAPMAAMALSPRVYPAMAVSARLYTCWKMFPINRGMANHKIFFRGLPTVMSPRRAWSFRTVITLSFPAYPTPRST